MCETIRINGEDVPVDQFDGPNPLELANAYRRLSQKRRAERDLAAGCSMQSSHVQLHGVPRLQKHRGQRFAGVRIK